MRPRACARRSRDFAGYAARPEPRGAISLLLEGSGDLQFDFVADQRNGHAEAEVAALDLGFSFEADIFLAAHLRGHLACAVEVDIEHDLLGYAVEREVS